MSNYSSGNWDVLLLGGAAGMGKTSVSYRLVRHFGVGITEVDDFQVLSETPLLAHASRSCRRIA